MVDFSDTKIAFANKSDRELQLAYLLFKIMNSRFLVWISTHLTLLALSIKLPLKNLIRKTVFAHFCGGETLHEARETIVRLNKSNIKTILDYAVEGSVSEESYERTAEEIINMIEFCRKIPAVSFISVKMTGIVRKKLLERASNETHLTEAELREFAQVKSRLNRLCKAACNADIYINIDAEETCFQMALDEMILDMMREYNKKKPIVSNTYQMYVREKIFTIKKHYDISRREEFYYGVKLVRGAYLEKERRVATAKKQMFPVFHSKKETDNALDDAIAFCLDDVDHISICVASHNEKSCLHTTQLMGQKKIRKNHPNVWFAQLLGMSDHISYNLTHEQYNVAKYVPYGPILTTMPYLIRRAEENTSIAGQMGRELKNITAEIKRRRLAVS